MSSQCVRSQYVADHQPPKISSHCRKHQKIFIWQKIEIKENTLMCEISCIWNRNKFNQNETLCPFETDSEGLYSLAIEMSNQYIIENEENEGQRGDLSSDQPNRTNSVRQNANGSGLGSNQLQGEQPMFLIGSDSHTRQVGFPQPNPGFVETTRLFPSVPLETFQQDQSRNEDDLCIMFSPQQTAPPLQSFQGLRLGNNGLTVGNGIPILPIPLSSANQFGGLSSNNQNKRPRSDNFENPGIFEVGSSSTPKRRLVWDDNNYIPQRVNHLQSSINLFPQNQSSLDWTNLAGQNRGSMPIRSPVYDSLYENRSHEMDPHLQLFSVVKYYGVGDESSR